MLLLVGELGPATTTALAAALGVPFMTASTRCSGSSTTSRAQAPNPADRRSHVFALTAAGAARVRASEEPLRRRPPPGGPLADTRQLDAALSRALE
jgi:hypothetical protein